MNQLKEKWNTSPPSGIVNRLKVLSPIQESEKELSPKEMFQRREKELRLKLTLFIILNNLIWIMLFFLPEQEVPREIKAEVTLGHEIIKLPAQVFSETPPKNQKTHVILKHFTSNLKVEGHLREVTPDPHGPTGTKITVEISSADLQKLNNLSSYWQVYPYFKETKLKNKQRKRLHEIKF